jgi:hypothetical protein
MVTLFSASITQIEVFTLTEEYDNIEKTELGISELIKTKLQKERLLFSEMMELILESIKPLSGYIKGSAEGEMALLTISSRLFNDCEGAKQLLVWGLPAQASPLIRDMIECLLQFRLFLLNLEAAKNWLLNLGEYQPGSIHAKLLELGINAKEYSLYGPLSHTSHSNMLASLSNVQETKEKEGMLRVFRLGCTWTPETEYFIRQNFLLLFFLMHIALTEPLCAYYYNNSQAEIFNIWYTKVTKLIFRLEEINIEMNSSQLLKSFPIDPFLQELVKKKLKFNTTKKIMNMD